ncbi:MAG: HAMP domain-containing protein, partial [Anaerolineae bacterium]
MTLRSIRWRIAVPYVALILASMLGLAFYASEQMRRARLDDLETQLLANAQLMADSIGSLPREEQNADALNALATRWAHSLEVRVTLIGTDGVVLGESHQDRLQMDNHLGRPEVQQALSTGQGSRIRFSQTVGYEMMYVALAMASPAQEQVVGVVRVALPLRQIEASVNRLRQAVMTAALLTALVAVILALYIAERTARPVRQLTRAAERLAQGDLEARLFPASRDEIGQLTHAFNRMAEQLRDEVSNLA